MTNINNAYENYNILMLFQWNGEVLDPAAFDLEKDMLDRFKSNLVVGKYYQIKNFFTKVYKKMKKSVLWRLG